MEALFKISDVSPVGTIAYLNEEESILLRVRKGWQYISMGKFVPLPTPTTTTTIPPPTTLKKSAPSAAENMIPKIPRVPGLRLVALNEPLTGNMGGIQRVDYACYRQARQAGLRGTFRAFLASRVQKIDKIVRPPYRGYPVINLRGEMLFRTWNDLFHGRSASELSPARRLRHDIYSFNNRNIFNDIVWPQKVVWHGAGPSGERQLDSYCDAWTSSDAKTLGVAASLIASSPSSHQQQLQTGGGGGGKLLAQDKFSSCQNRFVVLCIEATSQGVATVGSGRVKRPSVALLTCSFVVFHKSLPRKFSISFRK
ncbi:collagen alpha-1(XV) chain-like isoform X3 [Daphnia pulicaria]|nr:collagen alpha-1(XV) chain-like isoform X3 [Daphnia pulicaria]